VKEGEMREHIMGELGGIIKRQIREEIPDEWEKKNFEDVQKSCGLVIDLMIKFFPDKLIIRDEMGGIETDYRDFLQTLNNDIAHGKVNARNASLVFEYLKSLYEEIFLSIPRPAQGK